MNDDTANGTQVQSSSLPSTSTSKMADANEDNEEEKQDEGKEEEKQDEKKTRKLYGRDGQLQRLIDTFHKIVSSLTIPEDEEETKEMKDRDGLEDTIDALETKQPDDDINSKSNTNPSFLQPYRPVLTLITGSSGTGKTALALALADYAHSNYDDAKTYFIAGKFDQFHRLEFGSYYPIKAALDDYFKQVLAREESSVVNLLGMELLNRLSADVLLLMNSIPTLHQILVQASQTNEDEQESSVAGSLHASDFGSSDGIPSSNLAATESDERFRFIIRNILQIVCSHERPIILLIDDWQWADESSLELLIEILQDICIQGLMVLGACRGNEVGFDDALSVMLRRLEDEDVCDIVDVQVSSLNLEEVEALMSDTLLAKAQINLAPDARLELAKFIHRHTVGNAFGTKQMVEFLAKEIPHIDYTTGNLQEQLDQHMSSKIQDLKFDIGEVDALVSIVLLRLAELPQDVQDLLKTCACLGKDFAADVVIAAMLGIDGVKAALDTAEDLDLLYSLSKPHDHFHFVHDKIQEASYRMIPEQAKANMHLTVGRNLKQAMEEGRIKSDPQLLLNQFHRCIDLFKTEEDRVILAALCLQAARASHNSSSITASIDYLELGISLLPRRHWRDYYSLSMDLKCSAAEVYYAIGKFEKTAALVEEVVKESTEESDVARAQCILIFSLGSQHMIVEAMDQSLSTLKHLGEAVPSRIRTLNVMLEAQKTSRELKAMRDSDILMLPPMRNANKLVALNILNIVFLYNFSSRPPAAAVIAMRMVRLTLEDGLSAVSAIGFAAYGMILSNGFGDMKNGARFGKLALQIFDKFAKPEWYCRVNVLVWACLLPGHLPIRQCTPYMRKAGIAGLAAGDIEFAMLGVVLYTAYSIISSRPLKALFQEGLDFLDRMKLHRQDLVLLWHLPLMQVISTLMGDTKTDKPAVLTGKYMNEKDGLDEAFARKNVSTLTVINYNKLTVAVTMSDWEAAENVCFAWEKYCDFSTIMVPVQDYARFMMALASLVRLRPGAKGNRLRRKRARRYLNVLRKRLQFSEENYLHRVVLLEAEEAMSKNLKDMAKEKYRRAAELAGKQNFWMEQGIAYERLALCLSENHQNLEDESVALLQKAKKAYEMWGAVVKIKQLDGMLRAHRRIDKINRDFANWMATNYPKR